MKHIYWLKLIVDGKIIDDEETLKLYKSSYDILEVIYLLLILQNIQKVEKKNKIHKKTSDTLL